jgi:hypothetical protein
MDQEIKDLLEAGAAAAAIITCVAGGLMFAGRYFRARSARTASTPNIDAVKKEKFMYPEMGEAGPNLLHPRVRQVDQGAKVAVSAVVPEKEELMILFSGAPDSAAAQNGSPSMGDWFYTVMPAPLNWRGQRYEPGSTTVGPSQSFKAQGGKAELDMRFERLGEVQVEVYENGAQAPSWTKTFHVVPPG